MANLAFRPSPFRGALEGRDANPVPNRYQRLQPAFSLSSGMKKAGHSREGEDPGMGGLLLNYGLAFS